MTATHPRKIFLNLPVRDLNRTKDFFSKLGFRFNKQFTDETAACMVVSEEAFVMLLTEEKFKEFTKKDICDTARCTEALFSISAASRAEVDVLVDAAIRAGGSRAGEPLDHGFMYMASFHDLDGHHWEAVFMEPSAIEG